MTDRPCKDKAHRFEESRDHLGITLVCLDCPVLAFVSHRDMRMQHVPSFTRRRIYESERDWYIKELES